jgi:putative transposase
VERNALRAGLVDKAEQWRYSSLWRYYRDPDRRGLLSDWPVPRPSSWLKLVNQPQTEREEVALRQSIQRSRPFGDPDWTATKIAELGLEWTIRPRGRPRKAKEH